MSHHPRGKHGRGGFKPGYHNPSPAKPKVTASTKGPI